MSIVAQSKPSRDINSALWVSGNASQAPRAASSLLILSRRRFFMGIA